MEKSISDLRWEAAQTYEKNFWSRQTWTGNSPFEWYDIRAQDIWKNARPLIGSGAPFSVLEIGSGPVGIVNYIKADERHSIDPLEYYFNTRPEFIAVRDRAVIRHNGIGEDVNKLGKNFSLVIIDNVLDHMKDPATVLRGIHQCLKENGIMFLSLNIYTDLGVLIRNAIELIQIDKGHPFNFSRQSIIELLNKCGFKIIVSKTDSYEASKRRYRESGRPLRILKSYIGVSDFRFSAYCRKY